MLATTRRISETYRARRLRSNTAPSARSRAAWPRRRRNTGSSPSRNIASASAVLSRGSTSNPVMPSRTTSRQPGTFDAIIGRPMPDASSNDFGKPSRYDGRHTTCERARIRSNVGPMTEPLDDAFGVPRLRAPPSVSDDGLPLIDSADQQKTPGGLQQSHAARGGDEFTNTLVAEHPRHQHERDRFRGLCGERKLVQIDSRAADQMRQLLGNHGVSRQSSADLRGSGR